DGQSLSYAELNARANRVAHSLISLGVQPDERVAVCAERSLEMVVGILAILKAGGAYVPLDPAYPSARLAYMLADAQPVALLTQRALQANLGSGLPTLLLDADMGSTDSDNPVVPGLSARHLAYVIYTSGSTGQPKGVMVEHASVVNFLSSMATQPGLSANDKLLALTTLSFDIAGLELYLPLIRGAQCLLVSHETSKQADKLCGMIERLKPSVIQATPSTWSMLLQQDWIPGAGLKVLCGGEVMSSTLRQQLIASAAEVWNLYGPTETTIWSLTSRVLSMEGTLSIGRPIANTRIYILDPHGQPVPVGVRGEI
ncbi:non-ribosomal peptide synthetase, partial [Dickeya dadantii]|uniref:AMP-binding protein n=1 Tax=Dickeya dadantii TaxID=204038 RepID=UPI001495596A